MTSRSHQSPAPRGLLLVPVLITLAITLARLALELGGGPAWLASREGGGGFAVLGITWLPFVFGPWFALRVREADPSAGFWRVLRRSLWLLWLYGLAARVPVVLISFLALWGDWGTHYEVWPFEASDWTYAGMTVLAQLGFWASIWTPIAGALAAALVLGFARPAAARASMAD